ncbi:hypothetical protein GCM10010123_45310 [Pilimelia anulata]|uniref:Extracellular small neutral protease n=1 Tax=Pilimelia anulata TaxID=53371 RepID=A0A8J3FEV8_9ACTN|nr:snapalysin family zinc-dependent metalloprotease [Pilimelia anulata]GGK10295.1 hypothetical protein GCM10010123_45310 [Pilimelia anulata]
MRRRDVLRIAAAGLTAAVAGVTFIAPSASAQNTSAAPAAVRVIKYDPKGAGKYTDVVNQAAEVWNKHVPEIKLEIGSPPSITFTTGSGWPNTQMQGFGRGVIHMGNQAIDPGPQGGHDPLRVAVHEFGHALSLPDYRQKPCEWVMSGSAHPNTCRHSEPAPEEAAEVKRKAGGGVPVAPHHFTHDEYSYQH